MQRTGWRMWIAPTTIMLCTLLGYIDRQVLAVLNPEIRRETGITIAEYTNAVSAFSITYTLTNFMWGSILDYIGLRRGMLIAVAVWTAASASHSLVGSYLGFAVARAFLGMGEGAAFPGALRTASEALPDRLRSRGMALGYSGASLGALITPPIVTPLSQAYGWRFAFALTGILGIVWMIAWFAVARPPRLAEQRTGQLKIQWPNFAERRLWVIVSSFGLGGLALGVVGYLSPNYLDTVLHMSATERGNVLWIPFVGWELGYFFWGWVADRYVQQNPRPAWVFLLLSVLSLPVAFVTLVHTWQAVIALFFWATFVADGFVVMSLRVGSLIYPKDRTGMVAGIGSGSWGAVQAAILPIYGIMFDHSWYTWCFVSMALLPSVGTAAWLYLSKPWKTSIATA